MALLLQIPEGTHNDLCPHCRVGIPGLKAKSTSWCCCAQFFVSAIRCMCKTHVCKHNTSQDRLVRTCREHNHWSLSWCSFATVQRVAQVYRCYILMYKKVVWTPELSAMSNIALWWTDVPYCSHSFWSVHANIVIGISPEVVDWELIVVVWSKFCTHRCQRSLNVQLVEVPELGVGTNISQIKIFASIGFNWICTKE